MIGLLCSLSTIFLFCSGGIIPKQFLPSSIQKLGIFLPSSFWLSYLKKMVLHTITLPIIFFCLILGSCFKGVEGGFLYQERKKI